MARIRPVTPLDMPKAHVFGVATVNGGIQTVQASGAFVAPALEAHGDGSVEVFVGNVLAVGAVQPKAIRLAQGLALAVRRSVSTSATVRPKRVIVAGTAVRIQAKSAVVQLYDASNNPSGFGPVDDPDGFFFGDTSLVPGDVFWATNVTSGVSLEILDGGARIATAASLPPGTPWSCTVWLRRAIGGVRSSFPHSGVLS